MTASHAGHTSHHGLLLCLHHLLLLLELLHHRFFCWELFHHHITDLVSVLVDRVRCAQEHRHVEYQLHVDALDRGLKPFEITSSRLACGSACLIACSFLQSIDLL